MFNFFYNKQIQELKEENLRLKYELSGEYNTPFEEWRKKNG